MLGKGLESLIPPHQNEYGAGQGTQEPETNTEMPSAQSGEAESGEETSRQEEIYTEDAGGEIAEPIRNEATPHQSTAEPEHSSIHGREHGTGREPRSTGQAPDGSGEMPVQEDWAVFQIEIDKIKPNPHQPRKYFDEESLRELAVSIREFGIIQPLVVSKI